MKKVKLMLSRFLIVTMMMNSTMPAYASVNEVGTESSYSAEAETESETSAENEIEVAEESEEAGEAEEESEAEVEIETESEMENESESDITGESDYDGEMKSESEQEAAEKTETETDIESEKTGELETDVESEEEISQQIDSETESEAEMPTETEGETEIRTEAESESKPAEVENAPAVESTPTVTESTAVKVECICNVKCTENEFNADCPVCGMDNEDIESCCGEEFVTVKTELDELEIAVDDECFVTEDIGLPDNEELLESYLENLFYGELNAGISMYGDYGEESLTLLDAIIYDALKIEVAKIASGERASSIIEVDVSNTWTEDDLGVTIYDGEWNNDATDMLCSVGVSNIVKLLMTNCPYEMYWYDKTEGVKVTSGYHVSGEKDDENEEYVLKTDGTVTFTFAVSADYQSYVAAEVDNSKALAAVSAAEYAKEIVSDYAEKSDYEKLSGYKEEICSLVDYNDDAAAGNTDFGAPWQLIYVFDQDTSTNVVCEGYSKAFQYLCDLSDFESESLACYTVTGTMTSDSSSGSHMWNLVKMEDDKVYLIDATNCDDGTIGSPDYLFLAGAEGTKDTGYIISFEKNGSTCNVTYIYDSSTSGLYSEGILTLNSENYAEGGSQLMNGWVETDAGRMYYRDGKPICGEVIEVDGSFFYLDDNGYMVTNMWLHDQDENGNACSRLFTENGEAKRSEEFEIYNGYAGSVN